MVMPKKKCASNNETCGVWLQTVDQPPPTSNIHFGALRLTPPKATPSEPKKAEYIKDSQKSAVGSRCWSQPFHRSLFWTWRFNWLVRTTPTLLLICSEHLGSGKWSSISHICSSRFARPSIKTQQTTTLRIMRSQVLGGDWRSQNKPYIIQIQTKPLYIFWRIPIPIAR